MSQLGQHVLRRDDDNTGSMIAVKKPLYITLNNRQDAQLLAQQIEYFGLTTKHCPSAADLGSAIDDRSPLAILIDINFQGENNGLAIIESQYNNNAKRAKIPVIFYSEKEISFEQKLQCIRLGGISCLENLTSHSILNQLESLVTLEPEKLFRVLIVDDSVTQIHHIEKLLNSAGMITHSVSNPLHAWQALESFQPEVILMDIYMPDCNGIELAKIIRQDKRYLNIPIIYLSEEDDRERQLFAMKEGGEDFITKPSNAKHLLSVIRTRGSRARELNNLIARDSLTGLYNHTHILNALDTHIKAANRNNLPFCFVMLDIDHFKQVNDKFGHQVGDDVIKNLSLFLSQRLRKTDVIGRYGGEEFAVILPNTSLDNAYKVMNEVRHNFSQLLHHGKEEIHATFSCGIASYQGQASNVLIELADQAMYSAKKDGRNCVKTANIPIGLL